MRLFINILLSFMILFCSINSVVFAKKSDNSVKVAKESVKKEKIKKVKAPKPKKNLSKKVKEPKAKLIKSKEEKNEKINIKKDKIVKEKVKREKVKKEKVKKDKVSSKSEKIKEEKQKSEKPVKNKKIRTKSNKELQNLTQTEREIILVEQDYANKNRSKLAMKLNPNLDIIEIRASHILVKKRKDALAIRKDILDGKISFEDAAKQYSLCPTGPRGGDLGYFNRKRMDQQFTDRAFDLKIGEISEPVGTKFGWHLIKVVDKR